MRRNSSVEHRFPSRYIESFVDIRQQVTAETRARRDCHKAVLDVRDGGHHVCVPPAIEARSPSWTSALGAFRQRCVEAVKTVGPVQSCGATGSARLRSWLRSFELRTVRRTSPGPASLRLLLPSQANRNACRQFQKFTTISCRYTGRNENFVLVSGPSSGDLETDGP